MTLTKISKWCVLLCNTDFTVQHIISEHNLDLPLKENDALVTLVHPSSLNQYFNFSLDMKQRKSMFLQELSIVDVKGQTHLLDISCIRYEEHYLLMGVSKEMAFQEELLAINQDLTNALRVKIQENIPATEYMEQLSGLNNELINTKRELLKKNVEISKLLDKEEALTNQLEEMVRTKDLLFSIIAHDLRSPLAGIINLMNLVALDEESYQEALDQHLFTHVKDSASSTMQLLEDLLQWYRYSLESSQLNRQICDLNELINTVVRMHQKEADEKDVILIADVKPSVNVFVDPNMISTVLRNLVANALKFTPKGKSVTIQAVEEENHCRVNITDTGIGIEPDQLNTLFDVQKNKSTPGLSGEKGTGFGLILVRELVERNGGTIRAESTQGEGTTFTLTLPVGELS